MKKVLLITGEEVHRTLYGRALRERFDVCQRDVCQRIGASSDRVDAIVYDLSTEHSTVDLRWLEELDVPVAVLTCEDRLGISESENRRILSYPVTPDELVRTLLDLVGEDGDRPTRR
jgi:hypothetical protein